MAPGTRRAANRGGYAEHDDFEGLPVRQWRQEWATIAPPEKQEQHDRNDIWAHELIHGMPKDANLLPPHTQELLRAARSGRLYDSPVPVEDEEIDSEAVLPDKADKKDENDDAAKKFSIKTWKQIPRNVEAATTSYLAPRRKGVITIASKTVPDRAGGPMVTRATVKRLDAAGNSYTEEVTLSEGQHVDGEIISTRVETAAVVNGNAQPAVNPMARRRPPPPKRKSKAGPGRGKKKVKMAPPGAEQPVGGAPVDGAAPKPEGENGVKKEGEANQDSEMADGDDNDDDDDEESDDGGEEEKGEAQGSADSQPPQVPEGIESQDKEMSDAPTVDASVLDNADIEMKDGEPTPEDKPIPPNPLTLAPPAASLASGSPKVEGSPLKNVLTSSPTKEETPIPTQPPLDAMPAIPKAPVEDSVLAEPPSTIVGDEPDKAVDRDVPPPLEESVSTDEALLPPPPEQVGNIASPKQSPKGSPKLESAQAQNIYGSDEAKEEGHSNDEAISTKPSLPHLAESNMTEDTIKPDDSASVGGPATASGPSSEVAGSTSGPIVDRAPSTEAIADAPPAAVEVLPSEDPKIEPSSTEELRDETTEKLTDKSGEEPVEQPAPEPPIEEAAVEPAEQPVEVKEDSKDDPKGEYEVTAEAELEDVAAQAPPAQGAEPDLLGGLMGELDKGGSTTVAEPLTTSEDPTEPPVELEPVDTEANKE